MPKPLSDLPLDDSAAGGSQSLRMHRQETEGFLAKIDEMLEDPIYSFAAATLEGIRDTVKQRQAVSEAQREAVENIEAGGQRHEEQRQGWERHERRTGRRYEGWEPSR